MIIKLLLKAIIVELALKFTGFLNIACFSMEQAKAIGVIFLALVACNLICKHIFGHKDREWDHD